jgi:cholera enterotoxin subunit A
VEVRENPNYNRNVIPSGSPHPYTIFTSVPGFTNQFFRAESRTPEHIEESRGIIGDDNDDQTYLTWGENVEQMSLYLHSRSETRDSYGYISINNSLERAYIEGNRLFSRLQTSYIYVIAQAPNIFYTSNILGQFRNRENQFSAMGGIPISQIIGWYTVANGSISGPMTPNPSYRENQFSGLHIVDGAAGYPYAGFPLGHRAWLESPWRNFAPEYCKRWDRYPDLKRDVSLSWCEHNTDVRSKAKFKELKARLYTKNPNPR